jgi:hypothetical protein
VEPRGNLMSALCDIEGEKIWRKSRGINEIIFFSLFLSR